MEYLKLFIEIMSIYVLIVVTVAMAEISYKKIRRRDRGLNLDFLNRPSGAFVLDTIALLTIFTMLYILKPWS